MCGIAGIIGNSSNILKLKGMLASISHRGPDATGIYVDDKHAVIGHNRLSIIDTSAKANQPFCDSTNRYFLSFNGEIYNYKELRSEIGSRYSFQTKSDTEVLLASYIIFGKECLTKLNGMFSFVIWDSKEKSLFAARDRFGVKPFYYAQVNHQFIFASEIKAFNKVLPLEFNEEIWAGYLCTGSYGMPNETFYKKIEQLQGGHCLTFKDGNLQIDEWYDFKSQILNYNTGHCEKEIKDEYLGLLNDSINIRFRSDVEVGFNLSGGIDSSLLLALVNINKSHSKIKAFTFYTGDIRYDELHWVEQMIAKTRNPLHRVKLSAAEVPTYAEKIAKFQDEPFGGVPTLAYAKLFETAANLGLKVLLDGQGMDEQWAGYDYYLNNTKSEIQGISSKSPFKSDVLCQEFQNLSKKNKYPNPFKSELQNIQYRDLFYTKLPRALRFNDRISMTYSTELREPFLDYRLVELSFSLPDNFKIRNSIQKFLLREISESLVPQDIVNAPKRALQTPQREWLGGELQEYVENQLTSLKSGPVSAWFENRQLDRAWDLYKRGDKENSFFLWQWINLNLLTQQVV